MNKKSYIGKAEPGELLCHGIKCSLRARCRRYNLEPNEDQKFLQGPPASIGGVTFFCSDIEPLNEIKGEQSE